MSLLVTLPIGIILVIVLFFGLQRFVTKTPLRTGFTTAILTSVFYVAFAIRYWQGGDVFAVHIALFLITVYILTVTGHQRYVTGGSGRLHWAPMTIIGFFVVLVSVDSVFIVFAQRGIGSGLASFLLPKPRSGMHAESRFPGVVSHDFHEKEKQFNAYQEERAHQKALGWQTQIGWQDTAVINQPSRLMVSLKDKTQQAIEDAEVSGHFLFPGDASLDHVFIMHSLGKGMYVADLEFGRAGTWDLVLSIQRKNDKLELRTTTTIEHPQARHD